jgi:uncharacterized membrane protein required for colicin V production
MTESKTVKYAGNSIGVGVGNAIAYFGLKYVEHMYGYKFDDPVVAMAMGGAIVSVILLELAHMSRVIKYVFDRIFPENKD